MKTSLQQQKLEFTRELVKSLLGGMPPSQIPDFCQLFPLDAPEAGKIPLQPEEISEMTDKAWQIILNDAEIDPEKEAARKKLRLDLIFMSAYESKDFGSALRAQSLIDKCVETVSPKTGKQPRKLRLIP